MSLEKSVSLLSLVLGLSGFCFSFFLEVETLCIMFEWNIFSLNSVCLKFSFFLDSWSLVFFSSVVIICGSVMDFSIFYMKSEYNKKGFTWLVLFFVTSMALFIFSLNMVSLYIGWDGLGIISYALVIYYESDTSLSSGMLTVLSNRVGDFLILFCMGFMFSSGNWDFMFWVDSDASLTLFLIFASMTKSAQMPFSAWLPAAMAAPTPVSALVHSSTLVTAGVYLLIRFDLDMSKQSWFFYLTCFTGFMAGLSACWEMDFKKIVALSTLSQLSIMMVSVSLGLVKMAFFHLISHAYFKALLFICVGLVIHCWGSQDTKMLGLTSSQSTLILVFILVSSFSLMGLFFLSGFYSKDLVFEKILSKSLSEWNIVFLSSLIGFSSSYSYRLIVLSCFKETTGKTWVEGLKEEKVLILSMGKLGLLSIFGGSVLSSWLFYDSYSLILGYLKFFIIFFTLVGFFLGVFLSQVSVVSSSVLFLMAKMFFLPDLSAKALFKSVGVFSFFESVGSGWSDFGGGKGVANATKVYFLKLSSSSVILTLNFFLLWSGFILVFI